METYVAKAITASQVNADPQKPTCLLRKGSTPLVSSHLLACSLAVGFLDKYHTGLMGILPNKRRILLKLHWKISFREAIKYQQSQAAGSAFSKAG